MNRKLKNEILSLRAKNQSYRQIQKTLNCSRGLISFHLGKNQKQKNLVRNRKFRQKSHPYIVKISTFVLPTEHNNNKKKTVNQWRKLMTDKINDFTKNETKITVDDIVQKFGEHPVCYLSGEPIDIYQPRTYQFDHMIPRSRGGSNELDNLGICTKKANISKNNMTPEEFYKFCEQVINYQKTMK